MRRADVSDGVEYALYALAVNHSDEFEEAERFVGGMLAEDRQAIERVRPFLMNGDVEEWSVQDERHPDFMRAVGPER